MNTLAGCAKRSERPISHCQGEHFLEHDLRFCWSVYLIYKRVVVSRRREGVSCHARWMLHGRERMNALKIRSRRGDSDVPEHEKSFRMLEQVSNTLDTSKVPEKKWELRSTRVRSLSGCQSKSLAYPEAIDHFLTRQKRFEGMTNQIFEEASTYTNTHFLVM